VLHPMGEPRRLVVVGGGAAGFFAAVNAARMDPSLDVVLLEKSSKVLSKVRVSGGGRCNVTHACFSIPDMIRRYPRGTNFLKKAFPHFFTTQTIAWFAERGVTLKTEDDGRMFPETDSSETIIDCLVREANRYGVRLLLNRGVQSIQKQGDLFQIVAAAPMAGDGAPRGADTSLTADAVVVACGGFPKAEQFAWLLQTGHTIQPPLPSLFTFNMPGHPISALMGVSVADVQLKVTGTKLMERGPLLITHWGCSGPAVLRLSAWGATELAERGYVFTLLVNWVPAFSQEEVLGLFRQMRSSDGGGMVWKKNLFGLPQRLWQFLAAQSGISESVRWGELSAKAQNELIRHLCAHDLAVKGKTTFKEEFVTCGGIRLSEVDPATMMSRLVPGLHFAGEILDVDGITGGFNFQHAWTSGFIAARSVAAGPY
jgi:predicted Rossmann fold flavoprotein